MTGKDAGQGLQKRHYFIWLQWHNELVEEPEMPVDWASQQKSSRVSVMHRCG
jgi:hypothetical protein